MAVHNLVMAVPLAAVAAVCQGQELEDRQGMVPGVALSVALVFGLGSSHFFNSAKSFVSNRIISRTGMSATNNVCLVGRTILRV